ncbi:MAG: hypothetical protein JRH20_07000 [Deltaproteobacteria bacterium]|nr:hypothetical protein [Deltaproteobacteria bacterium]
MTIHRSLIPLSLAFSALAFIALACSSGQGDLTKAQQLASPATSEAGGDWADKSCQVVLRDARSRGGDWEGKGWNATIDVADSLEDATVHLLYRRPDDAQWSEIEAAPSPPRMIGTLNYRQHEVTFHTPRGGGSGIEFIPFLKLSDGARVFDHNYLSDPLGTYVLNDTPTFIQSDTICNPVTGRIHFPSTWNNSLMGELRQGGYLVVSYEIQRLPQCRGTHNGSPAWDTQAYVRFSPGGEVIEGSVLAFQNNQGVPTTVADEVPLVVEIPRNATSAEIWFKNSSGAGSDCVAWDSDFGANYRYDIQLDSDTPRCHNTQRWVKDNSDIGYHPESHCVNYDIDAQYDANHCEFYLANIGHGYMGHYGIPNRWLEASLEVKTQLGPILGVGMFSRARHKDTHEIHERFTFARLVSGDSWQTGLRTLLYDIEALAFFIDVRRPTGEVIRLWQSRHGVNYSMGDAFSLPTSTTSIPYGNIQYAHPDAAIFDTRRACR